MKTVLVKEELEFLDEEMRRLFLSYFHKNLEDSIKDWSGKGRFKNEEPEVHSLDHFVSTNKITLRLPEGIEVPLTFTINWFKGSLLDIEVFADLDKAYWNLLIEFLRKAVSKSFAMLAAQKEEKYFFRVYFRYFGHPLDGAYYIANFRVSPATEEESIFLLGENYMYLDMEVEGIDHSHAHSRSQVLGNEITAILSVILNTGFYKHEHEQRWVRLSATEHGRFHIGFRDNEPRPESMPPKDRKKAGTFSENPKEYIEYTGEQQTLRLPKAIRKLFRAYYSLPADEQEAFVNASRMYQISLTAGRNSNTVRASYQLAALDALSKPYRENGKNKSAIMALTDKYYLEGQGKKIGELYDSVRSAHFHQGYFDASDISRLEIRPFLGPEWLMQELNYLFHNNVVFIILNKWLYEKIEPEALS
ncbi:hypothetical protein L2D08_09260 [Domibacillus sp. PGB-M46]|uniref:hypothetical protein n=1 Tax=Domibacillus sp. PGB-M46 TaxID=2910255 RepID=UPI001F5649AF|nr:hypothetical protein [Domibacillus sp. PGB-M46]MCI2254554.1 hypothetical protein [Domibacillus sp. PGB-M46]